MKDDVLSAVTNDWQSGRQVWKRIDCWSPSGIDRHLINLYREGVIERREVIIRKQTAYEYRRKQEAT